MNPKVPHLAFDQLDIWIAKGQASYTMNRGTFKTKDRIKKKVKLLFSHQDQGIFWYQHENNRIGILPVNEEGRTTLNVIRETDFNRFWLAVPATPNEHVYGCGEQFSEFDLKGKKVTVWVSEHHSVKKIVKKFLREKVFGVNPNHKGSFKEQQTYYAQPTFLSSHKYLVHVQSDSYQTFDFKPNYTMIEARDIPQAIHVLYADDFLALSKRTADLLGKQPPLPEWTEKGLIIASQGGIETLKKHVDTCLNSGIPLVGVWSQDWSGNLVTAFGYQVYWNWQISETLYPNMKEEIKELASKNIAFLGYINTFLKENTPLYQEAKAKDYFVKTTRGDVYHIKSTTFNAGIIDLTHPGAYQWYKDIIKNNMIGLGMKGWMADFGEYLPTDAVIYQGKAEHVHNLWPSLWAKLNQEAIHESKNQELFFFTRAGYTETIAHSPAMWAGDQHVDFSKEYGLPSAIVSALSMATIGIGQTHSDIGGYTTILHMKRSKELLIRWAEMNLFSPIFRCHEGNQPTQNAQFDADQETLDIFANLSTIYRKLSPYLAHLKSEYQKQGIPIIRPLFYHYDEAWAYQEKYQFLYGEDVLVSPVIDDKVRQKTVRLPQGVWVQFFTNHAFLGGVHHVDAPLGRPIAFYRKGSPFEALFKGLET